MKKLPRSKQITLVLIVVGVAALTSFLLALFVSMAAGKSGQPLPSPLIGLSFGVAAGAVYLGLANNRRVKLAGDDARRAALAPVVDGTARLIVFRRGFLGKFAGVDVYLDDAVRAQLKSPRFATLGVTPGRHVLETEVQNKRSAPLEIDMVANRTLMVEIIVGIGKTRLVQRPDDAALRSVLFGVPMVIAA